MKHVILRYGLLAGSLAIILGLINWFLIAQQFGYDASQLAGYFSIILALLCVPLGMKYFRDRSATGELTFGQGLKIGMGISAVTSIVMFFYSMVFFQIAGDDFHKWREKNLTESELEAAEQQLAQLPDFVLSPWFQGLLMFFIVFLIGLIVSIISSLALKNVKKSM
ncbi:MAG: DUF4199 domain-containing protein [Saprospiraceae bacterium]|nr:DUF4199 domain-containing protein [Saprospiraceae bacterium]